MNHIFFGAGCDPTPSVCKHGNEKSLRKISKGFTRLTIYECYQLGSWKTNHNRTINSCLFPWTTYTFSEGLFQACFGYKRIAPAFTGFAIFLLIIYIRKSPPVGQPPSWLTFNESSGKKALLQPTTNSPFWNAGSFWERYVRTLVWSVMIEQWFRNQCWLMTSWGITLPNILGIKIQYRNPVLDLMRLRCGSLNAAQLKIDLN